MKNVIIATTAFATLALAPSFANAAEIRLTGIVPAACSAASSGTPSLNYGDIAYGVGELDFGALEGTGTGFGAKIICNGAGTKLAVNAAPFSGSVPKPLGAPATFTDRINYTVELFAGGVGGYVQNGANRIAVVDQTDGNATEQTVGLLSAELGVNITNPALPTGTSTLIAGTYTSVITLSVTPG